MARFMGFAAASSLEQVPGTSTGPPTSQQPASLAGKEVSNEQRLVGWAAVVTDLTNTNKHQQQVSHCCSTKTRTCNAFQRPTEHMESPEARHTFRSKVTAEENGNQQRLLLAFYS
jgi:hypothetical protein